MGNIKILKEQHEQSEHNLFNEDMLYMLEDIASLPFEINFRIPVVKVGCGDSYSALLTAEGQVFTWGSNTFGELGIDDERALYQVGPDSKNPLKFKIVNNIQKKVQILDIACGGLNMTALSDDFQVYVWGFRMGIYPSPELTYSYLEKNATLFNYQEINQAQPRLVKNNLVFHKVERIFSAYRNTAVLTQEGKLLLQGFNDSYQMCLNPEIKDLLQFFPDFKPIDAMVEYKVLDVSLGQSVVYATCVHKETGEQAVFGWGRNHNGQLFNLKEEECFLPQNILPLIQEGIGSGEQLAKIEAGGDHTLFLTASGKVFGLGKLTRGQLGIKQLFQEGEKKK